MGTNVTSQRPVGTQRTTGNNTTSATTTTSGAGATPTEPTPDLDADHPPIGANEPDDATRRTMSRTTGARAQLPPANAPAMPAVGEHEKKANALYDNSHDVHGGTPVPPGLTPAEEKAFLAGRDNAQLATLAEQVEKARTSQNLTMLADAKKRFREHAARAGLPTDDDSTVRAVLLGAKAVAQGAAHAAQGAAHAAHGVEHSLHLVEQAGHAIETTHHAVGARAAQVAQKNHTHAAHSAKGNMLGGAVGVAILPGATYFAAKDVRTAIKEPTAENVAIAAGSTGFATSVGINTAKAGMALAKVGARFTPGLNVAAATADAVWAAGVMADSKASVSKKVAAGVAALGSAVSATNFPVASQIGAVVATGGSLLSTFL